MEFVFCSSCDYNIVPSVHWILRTEKKSYVPAHFVAGHLQGVLDYAQQTCNRANKLELRFDGVLGYSSGNTVCQN